MIRLTSAITGKPFWINPDKIVSFGLSSHQGNIATKIQTDVEFEAGNILYATESPSEVAGKVLEYRLKMEQYRTAYAAAVSLQPNPQRIFESAEEGLAKLSGLEEPL